MIANPKNKAAKKTTKRPLVASKSPKKTGKAKESPKKGSISKKEASPPRGQAKSKSLKLAAATKLDSKKGKAMALGGSKRSAAAPKIGKVSKPVASKGQEAKVSKKPPMVASPVAKVSKPAKVVAAATAAKGSTTKGPAPAKSHLKSMAGPKHPAHPVLEMGHPGKKLAKGTRGELVDKPVLSGPPTNPKIVAKIKGLQHDREKRKDLSQPPGSKSLLIPRPRPAEQPRDPNKDRLILMVRDPYWLHAYWDITRKSVERAKASLAGLWHTARPVLRLIRTEDNSTTSNAENVYRDVEIHGGVRHWYLEIGAPGSTFRLLLGYLYGPNRFYELARSNPVTPPIPGSPDSTDDHWADLSKDAERVYALSGGNQEDLGAVADLQQVMQEKLKRPIGNPSLTQFGSGAEGSLRRMKNFHLDLDAEMVVFGNTHPAALLTVGGEPVAIRSDGSYSTRVPLPNNRQVLAVTSKSRDGLDEQTVVIAVERNTKVMEPLSSAEPEE
jgi:hypothetical protein